MKKIFLVLIAAFLYSAAGAQNAVLVGGGMMYPTKNIVQNTMNSADHTTLVAAVKAAGLESTLEGNGPFTFFAPTNAAFGKLPKATLNSLLRPENKPTLTTLLTYHVVAGKWDAARLAKLIRDDGGKATLKTVSGGSITASMSGDKIALSDEKGNTATVTIGNISQSNGVVYVIDTVLMPQ